MVRMWGLLDGFVEYKHRAECFVLCPYRQMALTINGRSTGAGNRVELPKCVLSGIRSMFPDADGQYMGHREE
jgi:hypothetical protein